MGARRKIQTSKNWLNERKEILQKIKDQVRLYLGEESDDLSLYASAYKADIARPWEPCSMDEVEQTLLKSKVAIGGDFHPFAQAQRAHLRLIRKVALKRPVVLALECLYEQDQGVVDQYLSKSIDEEIFLKKIQWDERWGFPWQHYRPLFEFAKNNNCRLLALNTEVESQNAESLNFRDKRAAEIIVESGLLETSALTYVIYGDLHIAEVHLPQVLKNLEPLLSDQGLTKIYLNSEKIYFELASQGEESSVEVVRFNDDQFCILSSPPWVKWQSYLMYLEENFDIDLDVDEDEEGDWEFQIDHTDHVSNLVKMICTALEVELKTDAIEVYSLNDPQVLKVTEKSLSAHEHELAHALVQSDQSFYIPRDGFFYLSKSTVNHAASLAGQYIHAHFSKRSKMLWKFPDHFLRLIWVEAMSFLLSKFVNPKRKAQTMADLKKQLQAFDPQDQGREPLLLALDQKMSELLSVYAARDRQQSYQPREKSSYVHAARFIGEMLGERYFLLYQKQIISKDEVGELLRQDLETKDFNAFYFHQLKLLDKMEA